MTMMRSAFFGLIAIFVILLIAAQILIQMSPGPGWRGRRLLTPIFADSVIQEDGNSPTSPTTTTKPTPTSPKRPAMIYHTPKSNSFARTYWNLSFTQVADNFAQNFKPIKLKDTDFSGNLSDLRSSIHDACAKIYTGEEAVNDCVLDTLMVRRSRIMRESCKEVYNKTKAPKLNPYDYYVLKSRRLVWCPVFKASSSNWMANFVMMADEPIYKIEAYRKKNEPPNTFTRRFAPAMGTKSLETFLKTEPKPVNFIIVRDPIERMISAYRDKLEKMMPYYYKTYGIKIVNRYRKEGKKRFGEEYYKTNRSTLSDRVADGRTGVEPTFWEFARFVIDGGINNEHWRPVSKLCSLCASNITFDVIIKFEHLQEEESYFVRRLGLSEFIPKRWKNKSINPTDSKQSIREEYLSVLNDVEICKLYKIYEKDYKLLDYEKPELDKIKIKC